MALMDDYLIKDIINNSGSITFINALKNRFGYTPIENSDKTLLELVQQYYPQVTNIEEFMLDCGFIKDESVKQDTSIRRIGKKQETIKDDTPW